MVDSQQRKLNKIKHRSIKFKREKIMKLYYFNPNGFGSEYFVMAKSRKNALESLRNHFRNEIRTNSPYKEFYKAALIKWGKDMPSGYSLDEYSEGIIIESEIA